MLITQRELDRYRDQVRSRQDDAYAYVSARIRSEATGMTVADAREAAIGIIQDCLAVYGDQAQAVSASFFDEICAAEGIDAATGEMFDDVIDSSKLADKVHYYAGKLVDGDWDGYVGSNADLAAYYVHRSALENMARNCDENHVRYARVGTGRETCGWCFMLSSRGFDYSSEKTASAASHPHCDCVIVPGKDGVTMIAGYDPKGMRMRWKSCMDALGGEKELKAGFDALTKDELAAIKGRNRSQKWTRWRNAQVNAECERNDSLWLYRGLKMKGRNKVYGPMDEESARAYVRSKTQSKKVIPSKQEKHRDERNGRGEVYLSDDEIEELVDKLAGRTGNRLFVNNQPDKTPQIKETITVPDDKIIGKFKSQDCADGYPTDRFTVHYSDDGIHIVPARPSKEADQ